MGDRSPEDVAGPVPLAHDAVTVEDVLFELGGLIPSNFIRAAHNDPIGGCGDYM
jgi:hypothetical protein